MTEMITYTVFITTHVRNTSGVYNIALSMDGSLQRSFTRFVNVSSDHRLILTAILELCAAISSYKRGSGECNVTVYVEQRECAFEWSVEYAQDHQFSDQTKDQDLWDEIVKTVENNKIALNIKGQTLNKLSKEDTNAGNTGNHIA